VAAVVTAAGRGRRGAVALSLLWVGAATLLQMVRRPTDPPVWDSLFAEDGSVFLEGALNNTLPAPIFDSYNGYVHIVPRAIAEVAALFPIESAPLVMSLLASLTVAALSLVVYHASAAWLPSPLLRGALALAFVLLPVATGHESGASAAYVSWYWLYACFWVLVGPTGGRAWLVLASLVALLTALSTPLAVVLVPVAAAAVAIRRDRHGVVVGGALVGGLAVQAIARTGDPARTGSEAGDLVPLFTERVAAGLVAGDRFAGDLLNGAIGSVFGWACLVVVVTVLGLFIRRAAPRGPALACALAAVAFFVIPLLLRGTEYAEPDDPAGLAGARYFYLPVIFLLTALLVALARAAARREVEIAVAAVVALVCAVNYPTLHTGSGGARWKAELEAARAECALLRPDQPRIVRVPIAPPGSWAVVVDCQDLGA
jgi:hypothetical protein